MADQKRMTEPLVSPEPDFEDMDPEARVAALQPIIRLICTRIEAWRTCRRPQCRRAQRCNGSHIPEAFHSSFPPCIASNEDHQRWLEERDRCVAVWRAHFGDQWDDD